MHKQVVIGIGILAGLYFLNLAWKDQASSSANEIKMESAHSIISPEVASAIALNSFKDTQNGVTLSHPNHFVNFESKGVSFQPKKGPEWSWQLTHIGTEAKPLNGLPLHKVIPENKNPRIVSYEYGNITEEYHAKQNTVEQRFVLDAPLPLNGQDLVIKGEVTSQGQFEELDQGWTWSDSEGQVKLGDVTVFDANGQILMASMNVTAQSTEIIVDAHALANATYPVTVDPEIGANDFRISDMGPDGDHLFDGVDPAIAYNPTNNEYLVVWSGTDDFFTTIFEQREIYGQRINATTGAEVGTNDFRISDMGPDGIHAFFAHTPAVAYNPENNSYLVVWSGNESILEYEIYGQLIDGSTGAEIGANDFRISDAGPGEGSTIDAEDPAIAYNSINNEFLVVWTAGGDPFFGDREIYGQRIDAPTGAEKGNDDFRISDMGPDGVEGYVTREPAITYNVNDNKYLVVWSGNDSAPYPDLMVNFEIYGQQIDATGAEIGVNDFPISDVGPVATPVPAGFEANSPAIAYNPSQNEYLVVWDAHEDGLIPFVYLANEIYGQRINASTGDAIGANDFQISHINAGIGAYSPSITYNTSSNEYLVSFQGESGIYSEEEIFVQRLNPSGEKILTSDFRVSDMGPDGSTSHTAVVPAVAYNSTDDTYLIVWHGNEIPFSGVFSMDQEFEVYGQQFDAKSLISDVKKISVASGGTKELKLSLGSDFAGDPYLILGTFSGTVPGTAFDGKPIPLNPDAYTFVTLTKPNSQIQSSFGTLDSKGEATAKVVLPAGSDPALAGMTAHYVALVFDLFILGGVVHVSNPDALDLAP